MKNSSKTSKFVLVMMTIFLFYFGYYLVNDIYCKISQPGILSKAIVPYIICGYIWTGTSLSCIFAVFFKEQRYMMPVVTSFFAALIFVIVYILGTIYRKISGNVQDFNIITLASIIGVVIFILALFFLFFILVRKSKKNWLNPNKLASGTRF